MSPSDWCHSEPGEAEISSLGKVLEQLFHPAVPYHSSSLAESFCKVNQQNQCSSSNISNLLCSDMQLIVYPFLMLGTLGCWRGRMTYVALGEGLRQSWWKYS